MKLKDVVTLQEGVSDVLFHITTINSGIKILKSDNLTSKSGQISFTRSLAGEYHSYHKIIGIIFEVDGRALSLRYKGKPVAGYHHDYVDDDDYDPDYKGETDQMEDRIHTSSIKKFRQYIKQAIIYIPVEYLKQSGEDELGEEYLANVKNVFDLINLLKTANIPFRTVTNHAGLFDKKRDDTDQLPQLYKDMQNGFDDIEGVEDMEFSISVEFMDNEDETLYQLHKGDDTIKTFTYAQLKTHSGMRNDSDYKSLETFLYKTKLVPAGTPIAFYET